MGLVDFANIRNLVFSPFKVKYTKMEELMTVPAEVASVEDSIEMIMEKFESAHTNYLAVLKDDRYYGFIYKENVLVAYREKLKDMVIE